MNFNETGFRPFYHHICAMELTDKLRKRLKNCPDIEKATHAVVYGYIDPEKGLMLEVLGAGKQAPKNFYFKDPYEGRRISIRIEDVSDVPFLWFEKTEPRFNKKYAPRIEKLKQYAVSEDLEKSREFEFLDASREPSFPDDIRVRFQKEGLNPEECWVRLTGLGEHELIGKLLNQPYQDFGVSEGDTVVFFTHKESDETIICVADFEEQKLSKEDFEDGTILKGAVADFFKDRNDNTFLFLLAVLRSSRVFVPCEMEISETAHAILKQIEAEGKAIESLTEEEKKRLNKEISFIPSTLTNDGHEFFPVFSDKKEMEGHLEDCSVMCTPFIHAIEMAKDGGDIVEGIVLNAFTQPFVVDRELFELIRKMDSLIEEEGETETSIEMDRILSAGSIDSFNKSRDIQIAVGKMDIFNYALYQNDVSPIRGIRILNLTGNPLNGLTLHIHSDFDFFREYEAHLPEIPSGKPVDLEDPSLIINSRVLADLTETVSADLTVELRKGNETLCGYRGRMQVLAYDQWQGGETYRDLLPAFVLPNHPAVPALMHDAAARLEKWGKPSSLEGYQMHDPNRVRDLAAAVYGAIQKKNIVYAEPPACFSIPGQRIRTPETILEQRLGTCMDMTLLYAACLEAIGLHPILVMMKGHIFAGVWLIERTPDELKSGNVVIENIDELNKRIDNGSDELTFIECTAMCSGKQTGFENAEKAAKFGNLADEDNFLFAIDVFLSRLYGIKPVPSRLKEGGEYKIQAQDLTEEDITAAPRNLGISIAQAPAPGPKKITNKRELWESKLLDLSRHNMLLNLPLNASIMPIMSSHIDELEDALADGQEFHIMPVADWISGIAYSKKEADGKETKPVQWLPEAIRKHGVFELTDWPVSKEFDFNEKFRREYRNHRLYTFCREKQLDRELTTIYRAARASQQENGVSSLYLAIGLIRWFAEPGDATPCYAPLILLPIEIIRKSANQGYGLHARDEEPHFNTTLLEMLKQNYNLDIGGLDPLPTDTHGIDIRRVFAIVRGALYSLKKWDVIESCVIGNFSFAQFAMWNDIHTAGELLDNSKVVRSLMKGHVDWDISESFDMDGQNPYLPITVDATQLKAIRMADHGTTFVLHGPPGTGKSQTITGMIANLMAQGKTVLFVAEKMAALSVVQKRLSSLGIGDFCLELHSDKATKKQVLSQLEKALSAKYPFDRTEYETQLKKATAGREKLDGYSKHLHAVRKCGYSTRNLIDLYEAVRDEEKMIRFDPVAAGQLSSEQIGSHLSLLGQLVAAGDVIDDLPHHPLASVGLTSYSSGVRNAMRRNCMQYRDALTELRASSEKISSLLGMELPGKREDYDRLEQILRLYHEGNEVSAIFLGGIKAVRVLRENPEARKSSDDYQKKYKQAHEAESQFNDLLVRNVNTAADNWAENEQTFCTYLLENPAVLKDWGLYNQIRQECKNAGLQPAVNAYESGLEAEYLVSAYKKGFYYALINDAIMSDDILSSFSGVTFNESIRQFKRLDDDMLQQTKNEIFYLLSSRIPTPWDSPDIGMELNLLRKAIGSNARGMSIRTLFERIPHILPLLCPCMLMSPNSVAQYLEQKNDLFDIVIFDEASQLPTCKAVGALYRAKNAVIVGDPKQMPPTSFFAGSGPNVEDLALDDLDSILDDALALGIPSQYLQWHYRSTHESLIAFSNRQFYGNKMYTFPSADDRERHVTVVHVEGRYKNSTNIKEAEAVVAEIIRMFHDPQLKNQSVGVVTFNVKQQTLIENLLAKQFQTNPALDFWANEGESPLFVKNLENVQGDERDVILFSIGYGPDDKGKILMNFGPINQAGGGKRLNVAFSRARVAMTVFSSIHSTDIKVTENSPEGLVAFRDFLKYAEGQDPGHQSGDDTPVMHTKAGILQSICKAIKELGFQCVPMVGHSDFHVDIAVVDPYEPTRYMLGILLDGDGYRKTNNTRDREVSQIGVLKNLGWTLHRMWTIDWWDNRGKELKKLAALLEKLKADSQVRHEAEESLKKLSEAKQDKQEQESNALKAVLEKQAEEVLADAQEGEILEKEMHIIAETPIVADDTSKMKINKDEFHADETREDAKEEINSVIAQKETPVDVEKVASGAAETNTSEEDSIQTLFERLKEMNVKAMLTTQ